MKFTKEEAFEKLKGLLTNNGKKDLQMSERSVNEQLEVLTPLIANEEMELDDFIGKVKTSFEVMNSNAKKDNSDFVKQWEKDHQQSTQEPLRKSDAKDEDAMSKMIKRLEELENREAAREKEFSINKKKSDLLKAMQEKGIKDEQWANDLVSEISITEDFDVESKADSYLKLYNKSKANRGVEGATPYGTSSSRNRQDVNPFQAASELMKKEREQFKTFK